MHIEEISKEQVEDEVKDQPSTIVKNRPVWLQPNRAIRRSRLNERVASPKYKCGSCGLPFIASTPVRCQCSVAKPIKELN